MTCTALMTRRTAFMSRTVPAPHCSPPCICKGYRGVTRISSAFLGRSLQSVVGPGEIITHAGSEEFEGFHPLQLFNQLVWNDSVERWTVVSI